MREFGCVSILNGQCVVLFGGNTSNGNIDEIFIYSVGNKTFQKSKVICPEKSQYQAIAYKNRKQDDMTTFGYIRDRWSKCGMDNHLFPPQYLIRVICGYYWNEEVHLFGMADCEHYKIDVFELFNI